MNNKGNDVQVHMEVIPDSDKTRAALANMLSAAAVAVRAGKLGKRASALRCTIHEGKWWLTNEEGLLRPLTVEEVIELGKLRHPQFPVLFIVAESYHQFVEFCRLNCLPTHSVRYWPVRAVGHERLADGLHQPTVIVLTQASSLLDEILKRRQAVVYRPEETA